MDPRDAKRKEKPNYSYYIRLEELDMCGWSCVGDLGRDLG